MSTLKLHYDGWIALPAGVRQLLGLASGDQLTAELVDGTLVLRPAAKKTKAAATESIRAALPLEPEQDMLRLIDEPSGPENVHPAATGAGEHAPALKRRGRPPKMAAATNHPVVPVTNPIVGIGPAKLIKKSERAPTIAPPEAPPPVAPPPDAPAPAAAPDAAPPAAAPATPCPLRTRAASASAC